MKTNIITIADKTTRKENMNPCLRYQNSLNVKSIYRKVVVLGSANSGKTSFINTFVKTTNHELSQKGFICENYIYKGHRLNLDIRDVPCASPRIYENIETADVIMICYDVNKLDSLKYALKIYVNIREIREDKMPLVLVGTKSDLNNPMSREHRDQANVYNGIIMQIKGAKHVKTSAMHDMNVTRAFEYGLNDILKTIHTLSMSGKTTESQNENKQNNDEKWHSLTSCFKFS